MGYLILSVVVMVLNALLLRGGEARGQQRLVVMAVNYLVAACLAGILWWFTGGVPPSTRTVVLGALGGMFYGGGLFLWMGAIAHAGLGTATAATRLAVVWPIVFSILYYGESPSVFQMLGLVLAALAIVVLSLATHDAARESGSLGWLTAVFAIMGGVGIVQKLFAGQQRMEDTPAMLTLVFLSAGLFCWAILLRTRLPMRRADVLRGALFGTGNVITNGGLLLALGSLPGIIVFPVHNSGIIALTTLAGMALWRERPGRWGLGAITLATLAITFMYL